VIPCFDTNNNIARIKIRRLYDRTHTYDTVHSNPKRFLCYPNLDTIKMQRPLIITEGEFDALLLSQILGENASVVTLGAARATPDPLFLSFIWRSPHTHRYIATDNDGAGESAATKWPRSFQRVKPPGYKDWTEAYQNGVDLLQGWLEIFAGREPDVWSFELVPSVSQSYSFSEPPGEVVSEESIKANNEWIDSFVREAMVEVDP
jgi:hypothetical protein